MLSPTPRPQWDIHTDFGSPSSFISLRMRHPALGTKPITRVRMCRQHVFPCPLCPSTCHNFSQQHPWPLRPPLHPHGRASKSPVASPYWPWQPVPGATVGLCRREVMMRSASLHWQLGSIGVGDGGFAGTTGVVAREALEAWGAAEKVGVGVAGTTSGGACGLPGQGAAAGLCGREVLPLRFSGSLASLQLHGAPALQAGVNPGRN